MRICPRCAKDREDVEFTGSKPSAWCRSCNSEYQREYRVANRDRLREYETARKTARGEYKSSRPWMRAWNNLTFRAGNRRGDCPTYANVEVRMTKEEFYEWYRANMFEGCSVDRIDCNGHYEISNLQLVTVSENKRRRGYKNFNLYAPEGQHWCSHCKQYLPQSEFSPAAGRPHNLNDRCKPCRREKVA